MKDIDTLNYQRLLDKMQTQKAIVFIKDEFQDLFAKSLCLTRVSAPLFVFAHSGLNDHLNGVERPVSFDVASFNDQVEIVHSLAKWKRMALKKYEILLHEGIYTDMNAIRRDETLDFYHSLYVDQWDWEIKINSEDKNLTYLKEVVCKIYQVIYLLSQKVSKKYPMIQHHLPQDIYFISSFELEKRYPTLNRKERENEITRLYKAVFIYEIGWPLKDQLPHDGRAADYDDWNLNGDILLYYDLYDMAFEISSMGIRVDEHSLIKQLHYKNEDEKIHNQYCQSIIQQILPLSIGGGIGQSRLCMYLLKKAHIGEVQVSLWDEKEIKKLKEMGIELL